MLVRKTGKWYRFDQLKYVSELGSDGIFEAMKELCGSLSTKDAPTSTADVPTQASPLSIKRTKISQTEIIDLTMDEDQESEESGMHSNSILLASAMQTPENSISSSENNTSLLDQKMRLFDFFAEDESAASLPELLKCLTVDELKTIAKSMKLSNTLTTVSNLVHCLRFT